MPPFTTDLLKRTIIDDTLSVGPAERAIIGASFSDRGDRVRDYRVICGFFEGEVGWVRLTDIQEFLDFLGQPGRAPGKQWSPPPRRHDPGQWVLRGWTTRMRTVPGISMGGGEQCICLYPLTWPLFRDALSCPSHCPRLLPPALNPRNASRAPRNMGGADLPHWLGIGGALSLGKPVVERVYVGRDACSAKGTAIFSSILAMVDTISLPYPSFVNICNTPPPPPGRVCGGRVAAARQTGSSPAAISPRRPGGRLVRAAPTIHPPIPEPEHPGAIHPSLPRPSALREASRALLTWTASRRRVGFHRGAVSTGHDLRTLYGHGPPWGWPGLLPMQ